MTGIPMPTLMLILVAVLILWSTIRPGRGEL
jgi:hypothetical protein